LPTAPLEESLLNAFLSVAGFDADPDLVIKILGIEPTWVVRKGDALTGGWLRKANQWR